MNKFLKLAPGLSLGIALCTAGSLLAADRMVLTNSKAVYERDRAACMSGASGQDRETCLKEAGAALQESRRGNLEDGQAQFKQNRVLRCDNQPPQDRPDCLRRMNGEGTTSGTVEGGGVLRELVTPVVLPQRN
jgi:hypothetical protein